MHLFYIDKGISDFSYHKLWKNDASLNHTQTCWLIIERYSLMIDKKRLFSNDSIIMDCVQKNCVW